MAIRFKRYRNTKDQGTIVQAIRLTPGNVHEVVAYVNKNGGEATDETILIKSEDLRGGHYAAVKVAIKQRYYTAGKIKKGVRKAFRNDLIVRNKREDGTYEFWRIRDAGIDAYKLDK